MAEQTRMPHSIDVNPTAACNLNCSFCWGPDHSIPDGLTTTDWTAVLSYLADRGTRAVVFTGGEPLVRKDVAELLRHGTGLGMRVTLSTNALLLARRAAEVLPHIHEIGVPLDGSSAEANARMRRGSPQAFPRAIQALGLVRAQHPDIEITVRTVVSRVNASDICAIGKLLASLRPWWDRWKLYHFAPVSIGLLHEPEHEVTADRFREITGSVQLQYPDLPIVGYGREQRPGRYLFVGPDGRIFTVGHDGSYMTIGTWQDLLNDRLAGTIAANVDLGRNHLHGHVQVSHQQLDGLTLR
jgi:MoaA/NifB/PqqE/SkfB family radical SAM enzyme